MEKHFFAPSTGVYWVTIGTPSDETRAGYPADAVETPPRPSPEHQWRRGAWKHVPLAGAELEAARALMALTRRQFLHGAAERGWLSADEAVLAAATGAMPAPVEAALQDLPEADRLGVRIRWADPAAKLRRLDPIVVAFAAARGAAAGEIDAFFRRSSKL